MEAKCVECGAPTKVFVSSGKAKKHCGWGKCAARKPVACRVVTGVCERCAQPFVRKQAGGTDAGRFCSRGCADEDKAARAATRKLVKAEIAAVRRLGRARSPALWRGSCGKCGGLIVYRRTRGRPKGACKPCTEAAEREQRRIEKAKRRARIRNAPRVERVSPLKVLTRDGWRCQICGKHTPKELRGTCHPDAPEVDHVIPLAAGGEHTYRNTQCACRACNHAKGALRAA